MFHIFDQVWTHTYGPFTLFLQFWIMVSVDILLELIKIQLITFLKSSISIGIFLDSIISKMYKLTFLILTRIQFIFKTACSKVSFAEEEHFPFLVDSNPYSNVEFAFVY